MFTQTPDQHAKLYACLKYVGLPRCVVVPTLEGLSPQVEQPADHPVLKLDDDGLIHELSVGSATVTLTLGGVTSTVQLHVSEPLQP